MCFALPAFVLPTLKEYLFQNMFPVLLLSVAIGQFDYYDEDLVPAEDRFGKIYRKTDYKI